MRLQLCTPNLGTTFRILKYREGSILQVVLHGCSSLLTISWPVLRLHGSKPSDYTQKETKGLPGNLREQSSVPERSPVQPRAACSGDRIYLSSALRPQIPYQGRAGRSKSSRRASTWGFAGTRASNLLSYGRIRGGHVTPFTSISGSPHLSHSLWSKHSRYHLTAHTFSCPPTQV